MVLPSLSSAVMVVGDGGYAPRPPTLLSHNLHLLIIFPTTLEWVIIIVAGVIILHTAATLNVVGGDGN